MHISQEIWHQNQVKAWWYIDVHLVEYDNEEGGDNNADNDGDNNADNDGDNSLNNH